MRYTENMPAVRPASSPSIHRRMCVRCGYDGRGVHDGVFRHGNPWCPNCGCDFRRRPPQSYAEMEGLYDQPYVSIETRLSSPDRTRASHQQFYRRMERCLAVLFVLIVSLVVAGHFIYLGLSMIG